MLTKWISWHQVSTCSQETRLLREVRLQRKPDTAFTSNKVMRLTLNKQFIRTLIIRFITLLLNNIWIALSALVKYFLQVENCSLKLITLSFSQDFKFFWIRGCSFTCRDTVSVLFCHTAVTVKVSLCEVFVLHKLTCKILIRNLAT